MEAACRVIKTNSGSCRSEWDAIPASVRNGTEWPPSQSDDECMLHDKKRKKLPGNTTRASVEQGMARPRMAKSARIAELNLDTARIPEQPSTTMPGTVDKLSPLHIRTNRNGQRLLLTGPTTGTEISVSKIR
jgi:hypothetical protein